MQHGEIVTYCSGQTVKHYSHWTVIKHPIEVFDQLFFAVFGQTSSDQLQAKTDKKSVWVDTLFRLAFGVYMLVSVIVLMNLLIAMMTDTYVRIQAQSDIEWKFGLSKLVRNMHRTTSAPSPFNLVSTWSLVLIAFCRSKVKAKDRPNLIRMVNTLQDKHLSPRSRAAAKWLSLINKKSKIVPQQEVIQKPVRVQSPAGSHMDFVQHTTRIDFVTEWDVVAKKYRDLTRYTENENENENN